MWDPYDDLQTVVLKNGLAVYAAQWAGREWQTSTIIAHTGSEYDPVGKEGLAHFVEHMFVANAPLNSHEMQEFFEGMGGGFDVAATSPLGTMSSFTIPAEESTFGRALELLSSYYLTAHLTDHLERERLVISSEFQRTHPIPYVYNMRMHMQRLVYPNCGIGRSLSPLGTPEGIASIALEDVRRFYSHYYVPQNLSVVSIGGLPVETVIRLLEESPFLINRAGSMNPLPDPWGSLPEFPELRHVFTHSDHETLTHPRTKIEYATVGRITKSVRCKAPKLFSEMLNKTLFREVREKRGWAYSIRSTVNDTPQFSTLKINSDAIALDAYSHIEEVVEECIHTTATHEELFEKTKRKAAASKALLDITGRQFRNAVVDDLISNHKLEPYTLDTELWGEVTIDDIISLAHDLRAEKRWTLLVRP